MFVVTAANALHAQATLETARLLATPRLTLPAYRERATDPTFGTSFIRVTEPGRALVPGMRCDPAYCRHRYSSTQAWNADQSLLVIDKGCDDFCFLNGRTFEPLFSRRVSRYHDCKWHPQDPDAMICVHRGGIDVWTPRTNSWTTVFEPTGYSSLEFGPFKGNPSKDGGLVVVRARNARSELVAFAYDIGAKRKHSDIRLAELDGANQYAAISPSGRYIYVAQLTPDGREPAYVFTVDGKLIQHWPEHHRPGHGDMAIDADGSDVYVGISKAAPDEYHVIKRRLEDGKVTVLVPYGDASHVSARNIQSPGWVFVTYQGSFAHTSAMRYPAPFYSEVVALRIDGSGEIRRIAHTHSVDHDYISEIHASPSPDGSQVIWSSNWGRAGGSVSDYVTQLAPQLPAASH